MLILFPIQIQVKNISAPLNERGNVCVTWKGVMVAGDAVARRGDRRGRQQSVALHVLPVILHQLLNK